MEYVRFNVDLLDNKEYKFLKARAMEYLNNNKNLSIYISDNSYEKLAHFFKYFSTKNQLITKKKNSLFLLKK